MVDPATRNVTLQATLQNPDHALRPGMFAKIDVVLPSKKPVLVIPATAISYAPYGDSVFVIEKKKDPKASEALISECNDVVKVCRWNQGMFCLRHEFSVTF